MKSARWVESILTLDFQIMYLRCPNNGHLESDKPPQLAITALPFQITTSLSKESANYPRKQIHYKGVIDYTHHPFMRVKISINLELSFELRAALVIYFGVSRFWARLIEPDWGHVSDAAVDTHIFWRRQIIAQLQCHFTQSQKMMFCRFGFSQMLLYATEDYDRTISYSMRTSCGA